MLKHQKLIEKMTLEEKVALINSTELDTTAEQKRLGVPSAAFAGKSCGVIAPEADGEATAPSTCFPEPATVARSWDIELSSKIAYCMGKEAAALGVNVLRAVDPNVITDPRGEDNYKRFSEDPYLTGKMAASYVRSIQSGGVAVCLDPIAPGGSDESAWIDERALREVYLEPYEMAIKDGGAKCIGLSANKINGEAIFADKHITRGIIRGEWQYGGVIATDAKGKQSNVERLINGVDLSFNSTGLAGVEAELSRACKKHALYQSALGSGTVKKADFEAALDSGTVLDPMVLDEAVDRVLDLIHKTRLEEVADRDAVYGAYPFRHKVVFNEKAHAKVALEAAESSIVLLKNEAGTLPVSEETPVAFIGEMIKRPFSQGNTAKKVIATGGESTVMSVGKTKLNVVGCAQGFGSGESSQHARALLDEAIEVAQKAEVVVLYVGTDENNKASVGESGTHTLPADQLALIEAIRDLGKKTVIVLVGSTAVDMSWDKSCDALLLAGVAGQAGTKAVLSVISGETNPSGKLAETISSAAAGKATVNGGTEYRSSVFCGYRYFDKIGADVKYPFGFGKSYTEFRYSDLKIDAEGASFTIENTGDVDGAEIAQLYIGKLDSAIPRPEKALCGFTKVYLNAGESRRVRIDFDSKSFRFYNVRSRRWEIEDGEYSISVGASSRDIRLENVVAIGGVSAADVYKKDATQSYLAGALSDVSTEEFAALYNRCVRNGNFYNQTKKKKKPMKLLAFIPVVAAAAIDALTVLSVFVPVVFKDLYYMLSSEEKFLAVLLMLGVSAAAAIGCVIILRGIIKKEKIKAGDIALSQWNESLYTPDLDYSGEWKDVKVELSSDDEDQDETQDDELYDMIKDRKSAMCASVETLCREYVEYARLRGADVSSSDARAVFAALSSSRMIFIKNASVSAAKTALLALGEFLQIKCYSATVSESVRSLEELLMPSSTSELLSAIVDSRGASKAFYMSVLCEVDPARMTDYFESFIPFIANPQKSCRLKLSATLVDTPDGEENATVELTRNMWFAALLSDKADASALDRRIAQNAVVLVTDIKATEAPAISAEEAQKARNTYYATVFEWNHRVDNLKEEFFLEDSQWRAIDEIESGLAAKRDFAIGNKLINRLERFAAVYLATGADDECTDECVASVILPSVIGAAKKSESADDRGFSEMAEDALEQFGSKKTAEAIRAFGLE